MMELYIETLTGTAFELRVSPFETIISVKAKIQRLEGIPISQQHLIWQSTELDDDCCLHDYDIHNGATLKLVLAMRGGPINTRRVPTEDPTLREMAEYMEANRDDIMDKLPGGGGGRQVTLLVFREGDQLNFFRVVDRGDGTLTPLPESLSAASMYNLCDEEDDLEPPTQEKLEENDRIRDKLQSLRSKMDGMTIGRKSKRVSSQTQPLMPSPPAVSRPESGRSRLLALRSAGRQGAPPSLSNNSCLPPLSGSTDGFVTMGSSASSDISASGRYSASVGMADGDTRRLHRQSSFVPAPDTSEAAGIGGSSSALPRLRSAGRSLTSLRSSPSSYGRPAAATRVSGEGYPSIPEHEPYGAASQAVATTGALAKDRRRSSRRDSMDRLRESLRQPPPSLSSPSPWPGGSDEAAVQLSARSASRSVLSSSHHRRSRADLTASASATAAPPIPTGRLSLESLSSTEAHAVAAGLLQQASHLERLGTSTIGGGGRAVAATAARRSYADDPLLLPSTIDGSSTLSARFIDRLTSADGDGISSQRLPPVKLQKKKVASRCFACAKKTGLATSYPCRCGNNFCATHRYAELHDCTFDYKTEGRKLLEQSNPVVSAPKLPKI